MTKKVTVVVGGQNGSEGKGAVAGHLSRPQPDHVVSVRVGGPNAGHTVYGWCPPVCDRSTHGTLPWHHPADKQHPWKLRQIPVAAVTNLNATLVLAAGSEIDPMVLATEIRDLNAAGYDVSNRLMIDGQATVLEYKHIVQEEVAKIQERLGSTAKGIGAARADRLWRTATLARDWGDWGYWITDTADHMLRGLGDCHIVIEGTQGYDLGLHAGNYPFCTAGDARAIDFLAQAGISPWAPGIKLAVWVVARTKPIRVAGNSGPMKGETSWVDLGLQQERTTVTNKVRRVGAFDADQLKRALQANGGHTSTVHLALLMCDYDLPWIYGRTTTEDFTPDEAGEFLNWVDNYEDQVGRGIDLVGTSPVTTISVKDIDRLGKRMNR